MPTRLGEADGAAAATGAALTLPLPTWETGWEGTGVKPPPGVMLPGTGVYPPPGTGVMLPGTGVYPPTGATLLGTGATPLERWGTPDDVAGAAVYLASPAASFLTGQTMFVGGGVVM